ncbi:hypothetical protein [Paraburkholderia caribensis]|uniref:hypothetical protein n=1 Tax=Paraburkholderia caribensis TaxID=75105 RepID=UPI00078D0CE1|nr:hypothetical protein [Paraburkholderia caribensis]AMV41745.1 hypothetical protein ATN79_03480 [Paraburkholderia caribensis]
MPTIPTTVTMIGAGFNPAFRRVQQNSDFDCSFAVIAMLAGTTLEAVRDIAVTRFGHPAHSPHWVTRELIAALLAHFGYEAGTYEESSAVGDIPDLAIAVVDYDGHMNLSRHVLFHRARASHDENCKIEYVIDPAFWIEPSDYVQTCLPLIRAYLEVRSASEDAG